ncbi:TetR family transcriptional regulator [Labedaea rhizosphaerae]|uniref:TetR family transcriptional regulator n=1 Tax=Labedaea rhizosphaerae TaxID=598644 RepID=A0A4R6SAL6_LABRH|nr:TetR family transcriptional regulator [Labedaea rhizosphaerae]
MTPRPRSGRRTQRERRETTVGKLVDATIEAVADVGYARTSVQEICGRAGLSHGGMFRHFDTRLDLVVAAAAEVAARQTRGFADRFAGLSPAQTSLADLLRQLRDLSRDPVNAVWRELLVAARTDQRLRDRLRPIVENYRDDVYAAAMLVPGIAAFDEEIREVLLFSVLYLFDGESLVRPVAEDGPREQVRLTLAERCLNSLTG